MLNLCQIPVYPKVTYVITPVRWPVRSSIFKHLGDLSLVFFILFYEVREHQWYKSDRARFLKKISKVHKTGKNPFGDIFDNFCPYLCVFSSSGSETHAYTVSQNSRMVARLYRISSLLARSSRFLLHSILKLPRVKLKNIGWEADYYLFIFSAFLVCFHIMLVVMQLSELHAFFIRMYV